MSEKVNGESYYVSGIAGSTSSLPYGGVLPEAVYDATLGQFTISNQDLGKWTYTYNDGNDYPATDKLVAVWYGSSGASDESPYMDDPLILTGAMNKDNTVEIIQSSDSYGPLEGLGFFATVEGLGTLKYTGLARKLPGTLSRENPATKAAYEDFLGSWTYTNASGTSTWTFTEKVKGESYYVAGIGGSETELNGGQWGEAVYDAENGVFTISNQDLGSWEYPGEETTYNFVDRLVAVWYGSSGANDDSPYMDDPLILTGSMMGDEVTIAPSSDSYGPLEGIGYLALDAANQMIYRYGADKLPGTLTRSSASPAPKQTPATPAALSTMATHPARNFDFVKETKPANPNASQGLNMEKIGRSRR